MPKKPSAKKPFGLSVEEAYAQRLATYDVPTMYDTMAELHAFGVNYALAVAQIIVVEAAAGRQR